MSPLLYPVTSEFWAFVAALVACDAATASCTLATAASFELRVTVSPRSADRSAFARDAEAESLVFEKATSAEASALVFPAAALRFALPSPVSTPRSAFS